MTKIFISYRRADSQTISERIHDHLVQTFGAKHVFLDVADSIPPGSSWAQVLEDSLKASTVLLVIIGQAWEGIINERPIAEDDYVRLEIEHGLKRNDMLVIPVLVNNADIPRNLPPSIAALTQHQIFRVRGNPDFHNDMNKLTRIIRPQRKLGMLYLRWAIVLLAVLGIGALTMNYFDLLTFPLPTVTNTAEVSENSTVVNVTNTPLALSAATEGVEPNQILISRTVTEQMEDIFLLAADGSWERNLTDSPTDDDVPDWSPDGRNLVFVSDRDGNNEIYTMRVTGESLQRLTDNTVEDGVPDWSPDGSQIVFASMLDGDWEIYIMALDGSNIRQLTSNSVQDYAPMWSPDGSQILFYSDRNGNREIYVMSSDGRDPIRLTDNIATDAFPAWSPDGSQIVFHSNRDGNFEIYVMNSSGSQVQRLTIHDADDWDATWSADGTQISFISNRANPDVYEVYVMQADGSDVHSITTGIADNFAPDWIPIP